MEGQPDEHIHIHKQKPQLMGLILGLPAISLYDKMNKKMFSSAITGILTVPGTQGFLIGMAQE